MIDAMIKCNCFDKDVSKVMFAILVDTVTYLYYFLADNDGVAKTCNRICIPFTKSPEEETVLSY